MVHEQLAGSGRRYIEIVNWKKAQPRMKGEHNDWMKLYTSLLDNDQFGALDDTSRMLIVALWLYAAASGRNVMPADPEWLWKKIPMLNSRPNLKPLLDATDAYGQAKPFIRYCEPKPNRSKKAEQKRREESRGTLTGSGRKEQKKKRRVSQPRAKQSHQPEPAEAQKPANPNESEAGQAREHIVPAPARSAKHQASRRLGEIIEERFPQHWQDGDAEEFGWQIVEALGMPHDLHSLTIRSEWGAFAAWWIRLKEAAPSLALEELRAMAIAKADYVRRRARTARNRSAVWFGIMAKEMSHHGIRLPPARAGPLQSAIL